MTQLKLIVNSLPRDLAEFSFFLIIGFTAGSMGLIWFNVEVKLKEYFKNFFSFFKFLNTKKFRCRGFIKTKILYKI